MEIFPASKTRQLLCNVCNTGFDNELNLQTHIMTPCCKMEIQKKTQFYCNACETECHKSSDYEKHLLTAKHLRKTNGAIKGIFFCQICDIEFPNKRNLERHKMTPKHINSENGHKKGNNKKTKSNEEFVCIHCNKEYSSHSGLWKHMKKCGTEDTSIEPMQVIKTKKNIVNKEIITPELIMLLIQQNKEMQQMMMEQQKYFSEQQKQQNTIIEKVIENGGHHNNNTINNTNNDNKSFNLNFFLNERCKNAMNLSDFVNGVDISLDDLEETGRIGYVEGLSRIFCKEFRKLDITERPIHCSDAKRETIYIRENNRWEKDENKERLLRAVKQIGKKNINVLTLWQEKYPAYKDVESKENDRYLHILTNILSGETEEEIQSNYGKIMKNISKVTVVDKH